MPEDFSVEETFKITPLQPHPVIRIWKKNQRKRQQTYQNYKKRKNRKKKPSNHHIDIYV